VYGITIDSFVILIVDVLADQGPLSGLLVLSGRVYIQANRLGNSYN